jgi:hypothetical protein
LNAKTLEERIRILEDIEQIKQLQHRYVNDLTTHNWDDLMDCFTEDSVTDFPYPDHGTTIGKAAIEKDFRERIAYEMIEGRAGDFVVHPIITVNGDKAKGSWLLYMQSELGRKYANGDAGYDWENGFYDMEYVKENGNWKISLLRWTKGVVSFRNQQDKDKHQHETVPGK